MTDKRQALDALKEDLKGYLTTYLSAMGVDLRGPKFSCLSPTHPDKTPSCNLIPSSGDRAFHCFGCGVAGDIYVAAHLLEGKPLTGPGFITENVLYLARRFDLPVPEMPELTPDEVLVMDTLSAYQHAALVVRTSAPLSELVKARLTTLGWDAKGCQRLGVGSITSYEDYIGKMTAVYGHKLAFLEQVDLARRSMFSEHNLFFTVKDENGSPRGFACRNLKYEEQKQTYAAELAELVKQYGDDTPEYREAKSKLRAPLKYVNTKNYDKGGPLTYNKSRLLYLFSEARKSAPPLWVFEGYPDGTTAQLGGLTNACAIGATAFTEEHVQLLLGLKMKHLIFVLDADEPGQDAMGRIVEMLEALGGHPGLTVELVSMPEGTDDPDAYIRKIAGGDLRRGVQEFRKLPRHDMFSWSIRRRMEAGEEPDKLAQNTIPLIINEPNNLRRLTMAKRLAQETKLEESFVIREVQRHIDADQVAVEEEKAALAKRMANDILRNPTRLQVIIEDYRIRAENVEKRKMGYNHDQMVASVNAVRARAERNDSYYELRTGYGELDKQMRGIPRGHAFISLPGKANHGKSTFLHNLVWRLPELNKDTMVFLHTVDDANDVVIPRIFGSKFSKPSAYFASPAYWRQQVEEVDQLNARAWEWINELLDDERIVIADIQQLPATLPAFETYLRTLRGRHPNRSIVGMGDNLHLFDLPGREPGESKTREMSMFIKRMANQYDATMMFTAEMPKLQPGIRPRISRIKGTSGVSYDANANFGVYNDMKDFPESSGFYWSGSEIVRTPASGDTETGAARRLPVIELVIDKSKLSSFDGSIYYAMDPDTAHLEECSSEDQKRFRAAAAAPKQGSDAELMASAAPFRAL